MIHGCKRKITKDIYDRAKANGGGIASDDILEVFTSSELYGYGVYSTRVHEENGEYYVSFSMGSSCD